MNEKCLLKINLNQIFLFNKFEKSIKCLKNSNDTKS